MSTPPKKKTPATAISSANTLKIWLWISWAIVFVVVAALEWRRWQAAVDSPAGAQAWLVVWDIETTPSFLALLLLPAIWVFSSVRTKSQVRSSDPGPPSTRFRVIGTIVVFATSLAASWTVGSSPVAIARDQSIEFANLPPAYHDEYSYLLQARTFLDGRLSYPPMDVRPDLFHQMHVLNEYRTVSRYFPLTGAWIAPFEALGHPIVGHWLAGAVAAGFFFLSLAQIADSRAALFGGMLIALSPGLAVFSNLLLAHHPTMLALSMFTFSYFRLMSTQSMTWAICAAAALTLAMLGRPMTAAGFALPFGVWLVVDVLRMRRWKLIAAFALPLIFGFGILALCNHAATGSFARTAYQEYTETYTPSHRYGFNNAVHAEPLGDKVLTAYDRWATNLTPTVAIENVRKRLFYSVQWSLAIFPILFAVLMAIPAISIRVFAESQEPTRRFGGMLLLASVVTMHLAHVPYWFDGIMHWHYVFETAPLLLMLCGIGFSQVISILKQRMSGVSAQLWCIALIAAGLVPAWKPLPFCGDVSKISAAVSELSFARTRFFAFRNYVDGPEVERPALVMVDERDSDPQLSYVINDPKLASDVIICRQPETGGEVTELREAFPTRSFYRFDPKSQRFEFVAAPQSGDAEGSADH